MPTLAPFVPHKPIADNDGSEIVGYVEQNLQHLRDCAASGLTPNWNFLNVGDAFGGSYSRPTHYVWKNHVTGDWILANVEWGGNNHPSVIHWSHRLDNSDTWSLIGTESLTWDADENLTATTWSGTVGYSAPYDETKPSSSDYVITVVDTIRQNLMALHDDASARIYDHWEYTATEGTGSAEEPQYVEWDDGTATLRGEINWSSGAPSSIVWSFDPDGLGFDEIGEQTFLYTNGWATSHSWTSGSGYDTFINDSPTGDETNADDTILDIKRNMEAVRHASMIGVMPLWFYLAFEDPENPGSFQEDQPEALVYHSGTGAAVITVQTYGSVGASKNCIIRQVLWYSDDGGANYSAQTGVNYEYDESGIVKSATWDGTSIITVEEAGISSGSVSGVWDDADIWDDLQIWSDS